jgi:hypothetical protein
MASVRISMNAVNEWFKLNDAVIYANEFWNERPES